MGASASKVPCAVEDSPSGNGLKSIVSPPLEEFLGADKFWELYEKQARAGVTMPTIGTLTGGGVTKHECRDIPGGGFEIEDIVNGGWFGPGEFHLFMRHSFNKDTLEWRTDFFENGFEESSLQSTTRIKSHAAPFRVEAWIEYMEKRGAAPDQVPLLQFIWGKAMTLAGGKAEMQVAIKEDSSEGPGLVCIRGEGLDESVSPDLFWEKTLDILREGFEKPGLKEHKVEELPQGNFLVIDAMEGGVTTYEKMIFEKEKDRLVIYNHDNDEKLQDYSYTVKTVTQVLRDPFRIETWKEVPAGRKVDTRLVGIIQNAIDCCVKDAEAGGSWW